MQHVLQQNNYQPHQVKKPINQQYTQRTHTLLPYTIKGKTERVGMILRKQNIKTTAYLFQIIGSTNRHIFLRRDEHEVSIGNKQPRCYPTRPTQIDFNLW